MSHDCLASDGNTRNSANPNLPPPFSDVAQPRTDFSGIVSDRVRQAAAAYPALNCAGASQLLRRPAPGMTASLALGIASVNLRA